MESELTTPPSGAPESPPEKIGNYRILEALGEGGMGVVYLAEQQDLIRRRVAIKVIKLGMDTKEVIARFEAERQALALMNHPNIARVYEGSSTDDAFVMGLQGSVYGRFQMEEASRDLITSDWMFAIPFVLHRGEHWLRIRLLHVSSHVGDEYIERFDVTRVTDTQDALDGVAFFRLMPALGVYGGGSWAFNVDPNDRKRFTLRGGLQAYGPSLGAGLQLYGAVDALFDQDVNWRPRLNTQAGVLVHAPHGRDARLAAEFLTGPSPQGQFDSTNTTYVTIGLYIDL